MALPRTLNEKQTAALLTGLTNATERLTGHPNTLRSLGSEALGLAQRDWDAEQEEGTGRAVWRLTMAGAERAAELKAEQEADEKRARARSKVAQWDAAVDEAQRREDAERSAGREPYVPGMALVGQDTPQNRPSRFTDGELRAEVSYLIGANKRYGSHHLRTAAYTHLMGVLSDRRKLRLGNAILALEDGRSVAAWRVEFTVIPKSVGKLDLFGSRGIHSMRPATARDAIRRTEVMRPVDVALKVAGLVAGEGVELTREEEGRSVRLVFADGGGWVMTALGEDGLPLGAAPVGPDHCPVCRELAVRDFNRHPDTRRQSFWQGSDLQRVACGECGVWLVRDGGYGAQDRAWRLDTVAAREGIERAIAARSARVSGGA